MRNTILSLLFVAFVLTTISCNNKPLPEQTKKIGSQSTYMDTVSRVLYPIEAATQDVQLFDSLSRLYFKDSVPIKAYTIRAVDLLGALGMPGELADSSICQYKYVRVYFGYHVGVGFKLFIVPVQGADLSKSIGGIDMMLDSAGIAVPSKDSIGRKVYVLDLNAPCPNTCATGSPLQKQ